MKLRVGLDIGIASVGWGIVNEKEEIVDAGVRLFPEAAKTVNASDRRTKRASRRLLRRRMHRLDRVRKLLFDNKIIDIIDYDFYTNEMTPYEIRVKGLKEKLSDRELAIALLHLCKRRGIHNFEMKVSENKKDEIEGTKGILSANEKLLDGKFVCELQLERLLKNKVDEKNKDVLRGTLNTFRTDDYKKEVEALFLEQKKYNSKIADEFCKNYIEILEGRREYFDGPGKFIEGIGNVSPFGWKNEEEWMQKLFGRCTYFPEEIRISKNSYTAELFNLLNDLNNLSFKRVGNDKLSKEEKEKIIEEAKKENPTLPRIAKILGIKDFDIIGYRIDKKEKALFTPLKSYMEINKILPIDDRNMLDEISKILTVYQSEDRCYLALKDLLGDMEEEKLRELSKISYTGSHSLSKKAIDLILPELLETSKNQIELFTEKGLVPFKMDFRGMKEIPKKYIQEWILSPVVKRALSQTINVVNEIHEKYGIDNIEEVVIEMAREKNSDEQLKFIKELQKKNETTNKKIAEYLQGRKVNSGMFEKIKFADAQDWTCIYSGETFDFDKLIAFPENYEIDHIIPRSISFDDSQNNKVLVLKKENQSKGNTTPYGYLSSDGRYEEFKKRVLDMNKRGLISKTKKEYLLFENDLEKYAIKFIARNLVDTRYATRELLIMLKRFYADNEKSIKIKSVRGSVTSQIRKMWNFKKEREICHNHHAQDALIMLQGEKILNNLRWVRDFDKKDIEAGSYSLKTGEILSDEEYRKLFKYEYGETIKHFDKWRYSHYVDKKPNRQLTDETIYSTRLVTEKVKKGKKEVEEKAEYIIGKLSDIYSKQNKNIKEFFVNEKKQQQLLMYHHDKKTFDKFMEVVNNYPKEINPFFAYYNEHKKYITKFAKKENGPPVFDIKYRVSQLGSHLDLTHKYEPKNKKVVMLSIPSLRADFYKKGENYKFVSVTYLMMRDKGKYFELDSEKYSEQKKIKEIDENWEFVFSLYTGDIFEVATNEKKEKLKFKGINNDDRNYIEVDLIERNYGNYITGVIELQKILLEKPDTDITVRLNEISGLKISPIESKNFVKNVPASSKQKIVTIGKAVKSMRKIYTNNLGVEYDSKEKFVTRIKK